MHPLFRTAAMVFVSAFALLLAIGLIVAAGHHLNFFAPNAWNDLRMPDALAVLLVGGIVGAGELVSRYKTNPWRAVQSAPGVAYVAVNGLAGLLALTILYAGDIRFTVDTTPPAQQPATPTAGEPKAKPNDEAKTKPAEAEPLVPSPAPTTFWDADTRLRFLRVLVAGFGAMALFRSSFFNVRVGDRDVPVGFNIALQVILTAVDRAVDRLQGLHRHVVVATRLLRDPLKLKFADIAIALPSYCFGLLENMTSEEQTATRAQVDKIASNVGNRLKDMDQLRLLYLLLLTVVGEEVLEQAVTHFGTPS